MQVGEDIDGEAADDRSGRSVSLSSDGSRVAIGAVANDGNGSDSGHVRIYDFNGSEWGKVGVDIDGEAAGDNSGYSVSLSSDGSRVAIGAINNDGANGADSGHVRIYTLSLAVNLINMLGMLTVVVLLLLEPTMQQFQRPPLPQEVLTQEPRALPLL